MSQESQKAFDEVVKAVRILDDAVVAWIARTPAATEEEVAEVRGVMAIHGRMLTLLGELRLIDYQRAVALLAEPQSKLAELTGRITDTAAAVERAKEIVALAAAAIAIVVQVIALVA